MVLIAITFKRWGAGPDHEGLCSFGSTAVPRVDETVVLRQGSDEEETFVVRKVEWDFTTAMQRLPKVTVWLRK